MGDFCSGSAPDVREKAGVQAGDEVDIDVELDTQPREVSVPPDFTAALEADPKARAFFAGCPTATGFASGSALPLDRLGAELVTKQGQRGLFGVHRFRHVGWVDRLADLVTGRRVKW